MELDDDGQQRPVTRARPDPTCQTFTLQERRASGYSHKAGEVHQGQCWDAPLGRRGPPVKIDRRRDPQVGKCESSLINKREKLKELDSQIMSLMLEIDREEENVEGEIQSQDEYEENRTSAILVIESCLQHLNYAPSRSVAKEESRPTGKRLAAQAQ